VLISRSPFSLSSIWFGRQLGSTRVLHAEEPTRRSLPLHPEARIVVDRAPDTCSPVGLEHGVDERRERRTLRHDNENTQQE
jgi:hypothetical protein